MGATSMVTLRVFVLLHPVAMMTSVIDTDPDAPVPHVTVSEVVPCPEAITPPVTTQT